jgi:hypothetical protein
MGPQVGDDAGGTDALPGDVIAPALERFMQTYGSIRQNQAFKRDETLWTILKNLTDGLSGTAAVQRRPDTQIKWSVGKGNWGSVPHVSLLDQKETTTTEQGLYCVFLFREDLSGVYLTLNQGVMEYVRGRGRSEARKILRARARIIKATLASLLRAEGLDPQIRKEVQSIERELSGISLVRIYKSDFSRIQLHRNNIFYNLILNICELIYNQLIPTEKPGKTRFEDILKDEIRMSALFEDFVRNFYRAERKTHNYQVMRKNIDWLAAGMTDADAAYLPIMRTDICLESSDRKIIIDTKFHKKTFDSQFDIGTPKIKSPDLYQLFSYLTNERPNVPGTTSLEGILLYPSVEQGGDKELSYILNGDRVRVATVDLSSDWKKIHERLLYLVQ